MVYVQMPAQWVEVKSKHHDMADKIILIVAHYFQKTVEQIRGRERTHDMLYPKYIAIFFLRRYTTMTTSQIGNKFGGLHHTTILAAHKRIKGYKDVYPRTLNDIEFINNKIKGYVN